MIILFFLAVFLFCGLIALGESYYERDWPRDTGKFALLAGILLLLSACAFGQNVRWDLPIYTVQAQGGNLLPVYAIPGAGVKFYSCSGSTCTTLATTYISATSSTACPVSPTPMQVTLNGSNVCVSSADPYGNMGGWFQQGQYMATITAQGSSYNYFFTVGIAPGGVGCFPNSIANGCTGATTPAQAAVNIVNGNPIAPSTVTSNVANVINITDAPYNALGNGVLGVPASTDTANTTAVQAFLNDVVKNHAQGYIPCGIYNVNSPLTMYGSVSGALIGAHWACAIIQYTGTTPVTSGMLTVASAAPATPCTSNSCNLTTGQPAGTFLHFRMENVTLIANHNVPDNLDLLAGAWFSTKDTMMIGAQYANYFLMFTQQGTMAQPMALWNAFGNLGFSAPFTNNALVADAYSPGETVNDITITSPIFMGLTDDALLLKNAQQLFLSACQFSANGTNLDAVSTLGLQLNSCLFEEGGAAGTVTLETGANYIYFIDSDISSPMTIAGSGTHVEGGLTETPVTIESTARGTVMSGTAVASSGSNITDNSPDTQYHALIDETTGLMPTNFPSDKITAPYSTSFGTVMTEPERLMGTWQSNSGAPVNLDPGILYGQPGDWTANFCGTWENVSTGYYNVPGCYEFTNSSTTLALSDSKTVTVSATQGGHLNFTVSGTQSIAFSGSVDFNPGGNNGANSVGHYLTTKLSAPGFDINGTAFATGNLADWTNSGVANGNVPVWNSGTGKWTPGSASGLTLTTTGSSGAATLVGSVLNIPVYAGGGGGSGTVTSVALTVPAWLTVGGSPITTSGTLAVTATGSQTANEFLATPNGSTGAVGLRTIVAADVPTLNQNTNGNAATATNAANLTGCSPSSAGDLCYWTGSAWLRIAGNTSTTQYLQETASGVPSWTVPSGSGTVTDGSGTTTTPEFAESTSTAHLIQYVTPTQALSDIGGAPALAPCTDESSTFTPANGLCYFVTASVSTATPAASAFVFFTITTSSAGTMALTGTTIADGGGCSSYISGTTLTLTSSQSVSVKSDGTTIRATCTAAAGTGTVTSVAVSSPLGGGPITTTGTITCATCVVASSPGAGVAHFAGSTQTVTSSVVALGDITTIGANTTLANVTGSTAVPTAATIPAGLQFYTSGTGYSAATSANLLGVCTTCVTSAASLTSGALMTGAGSQGSQTITTGTGVTTALGNNTGSAGAFGVLIATGTAAMGTSAIASGACATVVTVTATGAATTDVIETGFNGDPTAVTGYGASATGAVLTIYPYPSSGNVNIKVCNSTNASITPGALTLNWKVYR